MEQHYGVSPSVGREPSFVFFDAPVSPVGETACERNGSRWRRARNRHPAVTPDMPRLHIYSCPLGLPHPDFSPSHHCDQCLDIETVHCSKPSRLRYSRYRTFASLSRQRIFVIEIEAYTYLVPFVEEDSVIFLKTIIPSRKMTKRYLDNE